MKKKYIWMVLAVVLFSLASGCSDGGEYDFGDVRNYRGTPAWELAKAVDNQDIRKIAQITERNPQLLDYQDPRYGTTLLFWTVAEYKYDSAEALLKAGANPDIISISQGATALYRAADFVFSHMGPYGDPKYVKLLLDYDANLNIGYIGADFSHLPNSDIPILDSTDIGTTPLMRSIGAGIEITKALVEGGADINARTEKSHETAATVALTRGTLWEADEQAYYLIVEKKADITQPYYRGHLTLPGQNPYDTFYPVDLLRHWIFELDSEQYERKMAIVEEFARQGVDYWSTEIPPFTLEQIQKLYPDTWEEYILVY